MPGLYASVIQVITDYHRGGTCYLGFSGGLDSTVLLHLLANEDFPFPVHALHVHHGLHPRASAWQRHCEAICRQWDIPLTVQRLRIDATGGQGLEAAAREARYGFFRGQLEATDSLLTAHQSDDQAETFLMNAMRASGPLGLAAMPARKSLGKGVLLRPLLAFSRQQLTDYAGKQGLVWIEDPSNLEKAFERNFIRHEIMPALRAYYPEAQQRLWKSSRQCARVSRLLEDLANLDMGSCKPVISSARIECIQQKAFECLSLERRLNLLRYWIKSRGARQPGEKKLNAWLGMLAAAADRQPQLSWSGGQLRRFGGSIYLLPPDNLGIQKNFQSSFSYDWNLKKPFVLRELGIRLRALGVTGQGLRKSLVGDQVTLRSRRGGERCRLPQRPNKALKHLFQENRVPPWERRRMPLIFCDEILAAVGDRWICEPFQTPPGEAGWCLQIESLTD